MHTVRRKAAYAASRSDSLNYNPFARTRFRQEINDDDDLESNPHRARTAEDIRRDSEGQHRLETGEVESISDLPHRADTAPADTSRIAVPGAEHGLSLETTEAKHNEQFSEPQATTSAVVKRAKFKELFRREREHDSDVSDTTSVYLTLEERKRKARLRKIPVASQLKDIFLGSWVSFLLLPFIPAGFAVNYTQTNAVVIFCVNFVTIIPSAVTLSFGLNEMAIRVGDKISALLYMTFGNAVQLIMSVLLLKSRQVDVLKLSLLGNILSTLLLTTGLSFLLGGINRIEQFYNVSLARTISMLLLLAVVSLVIPSAAHLMTETTPEGISAQSRGTSVVILVSYIMWLFFTLKSHRVLFEEPTQKAIKRKSKALEEGTAVKGIATIGAGTAAAIGGGVNTHRLFVDDDEDEEEDELNMIRESSLSLVGALITLVISVVLVAFNTQFATDSIQGLLQRRKVSQTFLGLVILPLLSNDPTAITMAIQDKMDMSISLALERCMQSCLLLVPLTVLLAWCMGVNDMTLEFDGFSIAALFASIVVVTYVVQEGKSNWLTGALLIKVFIIISLAAFYIH